MTIFMVLHVGGLGYFPEEDTCNRHAFMTQSLEAQLGEMGLGTYTSLPSGLLWSL